MNNKTQWEYDLVTWTDFYSNEKQRAKMMSELAAKVNSGWEIVSTNGGESGSGPAFWYYIVLFRREARA